MASISRIPASSPSATMFTNRSSTRMSSSTFGYRSMNRGSKRASKSVDRRHGEPNPAGDFTAPRLNGLQRLKGLLHGRARVLEEPLSRIREPHASRGPREQGNIEPLFEVTNRLAQRGRRDGEILGGGRVTATARDGRGGIRSGNGAEAGRNVRGAVRALRASGSTRSGPSPRGCTPPCAGPAAGARPRRGRTSPRARACRGAPAGRRCGRACGRARR